jgi:hypothetical protein
MTAVYEASPVKRLRRTNAELTVIDDAIVAAVAEDRPVSLRGVYYRVVSAGAVPKTEASYQLVGRQLLKLRRTGTVPYGDITDGTRDLQGWRTWDSMQEALNDTASTYRRALWSNQDVTVIVFTEKDAITGVIRPVLSRWDVPMGVIRGYASESFCWQVGQYVTGAPGVVFVYQLGDHDPSGVDAWRDFTAKVTRFAAERYTDTGDWLCFERLAVTEEQIGHLGLPTRPTKRSDSRAAAFRGESVEVDAIRAPVLRQIVEDAITQHVDQDALRVTREAERSEREILRRLAGGS